MIWASVFTDAIYARYAKIHYYNKVIYKLYFTLAVSQNDDFVAEWSTRMIRNHFSSEARVRISSKSFFFDFLAIYNVMDFCGLTQVEPKKCMDYIQRLFISTQRITGEIQAAEEE